MPFSLGSGIDNSVSRSDAASGEAAGELDDAVRCAGNKGLRVPEPWGWVWDLAYTKQDPAVGLCLGFYGGPEGVGVCL